MDTSVLHRLSDVSQAGIDYYAHSPHDYLAAQQSRAPTHAAVRLAAQLPKGALVVDAGCGAGVEVQYFYEQGFEVYAYDASPLMVGLSHGRLEHFPEFPKVHLHAHHELALPEPAHAIYAGASLLFLDDADLRVSLDVLVSNLGHGGILSISFKEGPGARKEADGRVYHDRTLDDASWLVGATGLELLEARVIPDVLNRSFGWTCFELLKR